MLRLRTFRRIVHCRREASMAAVWDFPIVNPHALHVTFYTCFLRPRRVTRHRRHV